MYSVRSHTPAFQALTVVGAIAALLLASPARAADPFRLDRLGVVRFVATGDSMLRRQMGVLHADGRADFRAESTVPRPENTPAWVLGRNLVPVAAWQAYFALGTAVLQHFELHDLGAQVRVGDEAFFLVAPSFEGPLETGRMLNLSAQFRIDEQQRGVAGFVIEERPRTVLIRAVGPTLSRFGVSTPARDPFLAVKRNGATIAFNDDWNDGEQTAAIRDAAVRVGAFPLDDGSYDAARLVVLPPGAYTVEVFPAMPGDPAGVVLLEIYSVPPEVVEIQAATS